MLLDLWATSPSENECSNLPQKRRRGATALEYLVCASLIIVVVILTVQHLGSVVGGMFGKNAQATGETISGSATTGS